MSIGWIKLHREIQEHWIFTDPIKFKWWVQILMKVNHKEGEILLGNSVLKIQKGQSACSLRTWSLTLNCSVKSVISFFELLKSHNMIESKTIGKGKQSTTIITVSNYATYQTDKETLDNTQSTTLSSTQGEHKGNAKGIQYKNVENENNEKEENNNTVFDFKKSLLDLCSDKQLVLDWLKIRKTKKAVNTETAFDGFIREQEKSGLSVTEVLKICVERSWSGFTASWVENIKAESTGLKKKFVFNFEAGGFVDHEFTESELKEFMRSRPHISEVFHMGKKIYQKEVNNG